MHSNFQWSSVKKDLLFWLVQFKQSRRFKNKEKKKERKFIEITDGIKHSPANSLIQYTNSLIPFFFFFFFFLSFLFFFSFFFSLFFFFFSSFLLLSPFPQFLFFMSLTDWLTEKKSRFPCDIRFNATAYNPELEYPTDVLDALVLSMKETAHKCNLESLEKVCYQLKHIF